MTPSARYALNEPYVVHEAFEDGEVVVINLKTGQYYSIIGTGADVWSLVARGETAGVVVERLAARYEGGLGEMVNAVNDFVRQLEAEGLVIPVEGAGPAAPSMAPEPGPAAARRPFVPLVLERFNDMRELLLLDPIHEVAETGWPHRRGDAAP